MYISVFLLAGLWAYLCVTNWPSVTFGAIRWVHPGEQRKSGIRGAVKKYSIVIPVLGAALVALTGCSSSDSSAPASEDGLRAAIDAQYTRLQQADWAGEYDHLSQRCQEKVGRDAYVSGAATAYAGRDFSGPQQVDITMDGSSATVVSTSFDGKGNKAPMKWIYVDGQWQMDNC